MKRSVPILDIYSPFPGSFPCVATGVGANAVGQVSTHLSVGAPLVAS